jgi:hypothetical protein
VITHFDKYLNAFLNKMINPDILYILLVLTRGFSSELSDFPEQLVAPNQNP